MTAQPTRRRRTPRPALSSATDFRPARQRCGEKTRQQGINFDLALLKYMRTAVIWMAHHHPDEPGSESLAALIDEAVRDKITSWERTYNGGKALPVLGTVSAPTPPEQVDADPSVEREEVPADQIPPLAQDETIHLAHPAPVHGPSWSGLAADFLTLARRTVLGRH
ncbi:hypothetical protein [Nocardia sp. NPDC059228]|uniref:hypothetical protein n=1 Tax=Nocardia sp. NPDC059228 TaxID=3346777 RepID=UPI003698DCB6